jgi:hypothetical protein
VNDTIIPLPNGDFTTTRYLKDHYYKKGHLGQTKHAKLNEYMIIEDKVHQIHKVIVHRFRMGDVEDPDLYAAQPLWEWQQSEMGKWVMEKSIETPMWHRQTNPNQYHTEYAVQAWLKGADYSFWVLKWGNDVDRSSNIRI